MISEGTQPLGEPADLEVSQTGGLPADFYRRAHLRDDEAGSDAVASDLPRRRTVPSSARALVRRQPSFTIIIVVLLANFLFFLAGGIAGWALQRRGSFPHALPPAPTHTAVAQTNAAPVSAPPSAEIDALNRQIQTLAHDVARLEVRLNEKPSPPRSPTIDLKPLRTKLELLERANRKLGPLPKAVRTVGEHLDALDQRVATLRDEFAVIPKHVDAAVRSLKSDLDTALAAKPPSTADTSRALAASLFNERKFVAAREIFLRLAQDSPNDARLWYFAALSNGFAEKEWGGETEKLVRRGLECEKAGTPSKSDIDAQLAPLSKDMGKDWLREWRDRIPAP